MTTEPLPETTRLLHIGLPKTGSTALQHAAMTQRLRLREEGVVYPGKAENHHRGLSWLAGLKVDYLKDPVPRAPWWRALDRELGRFPGHRALLSFEMTCTTDAAGAAATVDAVGAQGDRPVHVVLVMRNLGGFVPSYWQESLKRGKTRTLDEYLRRALADPAAVASSGAFHRRDGMGLIERWAGVVGPENLSVIVLEKEHPTRLLDTFENLLALPAGILHEAEPRGVEANRGMTPAEAALVLKLNRMILAKWKAPEDEHRALVFKGAVNRLLANREPTAAEGRLMIPHWAADACAEAGFLLAESVREAGVRVVGDLAELERTAKYTEEDVSVPPEQIPFDVALESLLGMYAGATGWDASHKKMIRRGPTAEELTEQLAGAKEEIARLTAELRELRATKSRGGRYRALLRAGLRR
ncbi:hypothetical protein [Myceligenerans crystallogenes]